MRLPLLLSLGIWLAAWPAAAQFSVLGLRNSLVQFVLSQISVEGEFEITAGAVEDPEEGGTRLTDVAIADGDGVWFRAEAIELSWNASRILRGELEINRLAVIDPEVLRAPTPPQVEVVEGSKLDEAATGFDPFAWPRVPIAARVEQVVIQSAFVESGVFAPQSLEFDASGSFRDEDDVQSLMLEVVRTDEVEGVIDLEYVRDFSDESLALDLTAREAAGGLVAAIAGLPNDSASEVSIEAAGPLVDWNLTLAADVERVIAVEGALTVDAQAPIAVDGRLRIVPGPALDPNAALALGEAATLDLRVREGEDGVVRIEQGTFSSPSLALDVDGTYERGSGAMDFDLTLAAERALSQAVEGVGWERIGFDGRLEGTPEDLSAVGTARLRDLRTPTADAGDAELEVEVGKQGQLLTVAASGLVQGLRIDALQPELLGETRLTVRAQYGLETEEASLETLRLESPLLTVAAQGDVDLTGGTVDASYEISTPALAPVAEAYGVDASGRLQASGQAEGPLSEVHLTGRAELGALSYQGTEYGQVALTHDVTLGEIIQGEAAVNATGTPYGPAEVATDFRLEGQALTLSDMRAELLDAIATGGVRVDLGAMLAEGSLEVAASNLSAFSDLVGEPLQGSMTANVTLTRPEERQDATLQLEGTGISGFGASAAEVAGTVSVQDALGTPSAAYGLTLEGVAAQGATVDQVELRGTAADLTGTPSAQARAVIEEISAPEYEAQVERVEVELDAQDLLGAPRGTVEVSASGVGAQGASVETLTLTFEGENLVEAPRGEGRLTAQGVAAEGASVGEVELDFAGENLIEAPSGTAEFSAQGIEAAGIRVAALSGEAQGTDLLGAAEGSATVRVENVSGDAVSVDRATLAIEGSNLIEAPQGTARLDAQGVSAGGVTAASVTATAEGSELLTSPTGSVEVNASGLSGAVTASGARITAQGSNLIEAPQGEVRAVVSGLDLGGAGRFAQVTATAEGGLEDLRVSVQGRGETPEGEALSLDVAGQGDLSGEDLRFDVSRLSFASGALAIAQQGPLSVRRAGEATELQGLNVALPGGRLTGDVALRGGGSVGSIRLNVDDMAALGELTGAPVRAGQVGLTARFDTRAGSASGRFDLEGTGLRFAGVPDDVEPVAVSAEGTWNGSRLRTAASVQGDFGRPLLVEGSVPLVPSGPAVSVPQNGALDLSVEWEGRAESIWALAPLPDHLLQGQLDVDLRVAGTVANPQPTGSIFLTDGAYQFLELGTILLDLEARSRITEGGAFALDVSATDGAGNPVTAEVLIDGSELEATLATRDAVLVRREDVTAAVTADIRATGPLTAPLIAGRVLIERAEVRLVNATPPSVATLGEVIIKGQKVEEEEPVDPGAGPQLDIEIVAPDDIFVRGRGLDSEWEADISVSGAAASPRVTGTVSRRRGRLDFLGRDFELVRGEVRFTGGTEIDPIIDVALEHERDEITGRIAVRGTTSDPELAFESTPALPEDEVLPRVLFGRPRQSLSAGEAIQLASGLATLASGNEGVLGSIRSVVGLDVLSVDTGGESTAVRAGRNVSDGVFVGVKQPVDGGSPAVEVEVEVFDNFTVDAQTGSDKGSSLGGNWKYDW